MSDLPQLLVIAAAALSVLFALPAGAVAGDEMLSLCASPKTSGLTSGCSTINGVDQCFEGAKYYNMTAGECNNWDATLSLITVQSLKFGYFNTTECDGAEEDTWGIIGYSSSNCGLLGVSTCYKLGDCAKSQKHECCTLPMIQLRVEGHAVETVIFEINPPSAGNPWIGIGIGIGVGMCCLGCCVMAGLFFWCSQRRRRSHYTPLSEHGHHGHH